MTHIDRVDVCVVGGGPAGMTLGLDLARRGVEVEVLEQSKDFDRSFRGESISPDCAWLLGQLGVLGRLTDQGILFINGLELSDGGRTLLTMDFRTFPYPMPLPAEVPQPMLLAALRETAAEQPTFSLRRQSRVAGLIRAGGRVTGVRVRTPDGERDVHARLVVGADGRYGRIREMAGLAGTKFPLERDFLWFKLPYPTALTPLTYRVRMAMGQHAMLIPTWPDLLRVGVNIPKNGMKQTRAAGIGAIHDKVRALAPEITDVPEHVRDWSDISMLENFTAVLPRWSTPGLILIGDAAHTLSPVLAQGVNHAIIDAVDLAPRVADALRAPNPAAALDAAALAFQRTREPMVARTRGLQLRQEKVFAFDKPAQVAVRRTVYRTMNRLPALKNKIWSALYYTVPQTDAHGALRPASVRPAPVQTVPVQTVPVPVMPDPVPATSAPGQAHPGQPHRGQQVDPGQVDPSEAVA